MSRALGHNSLVNRTKIASSFVTEQTYSAVQLQVTMWHFIIWGIIIFFSFKSWTWRSEAEGRSGFALFCCVQSPVCAVTQSCPALCSPHGLWPVRLLCPWNFPGKNTGLGCHSYSRGSSPTGIEPGSLVSPASAFTTGATWEALGISYFRALIGNMENLCTVWKLPE